MLKKTWNFCAIALLIASSVPYCAALRCYICSYVSPSTDRACIDDPDSVVGKKFITCSKKYCIIQRQELINPTGVVNTFLRGCEDKPLALNKVIEDPTFKTYYRSCTTDLCNSGDGVSSASSASDPDAGAGDNMIVPGKNSKDSLWKPKQQFFMGAVTLVILFVTYSHQ